MKQSSGVRTPRAASEQARLKALYDLLVGARGLFSEPCELIRFVGLHVDMTLASEFEGSRATLATLAFALILRLRSRGLLSEALFAALRDLAPPRAREVDKVAALWLQSCPEEHERGRHDHGASTPRAHGSSIRVFLRNAEFGVCVRVRVARDATVASLSTALRSHLAQPPSHKDQAMGFSVNVSVYNRGALLEPNNRLSDLGVGDGHMLDVCLAFTPYVRGKRGRQLVFKRASHDGSDPPEFAAKISQLTEREILVLPPGEPPGDLPQ